MTQTEKKNIDIIIPFAGKCKIGLTDQVMMHLVQRFFCMTPAMNKNQGNVGMREQQTNKLAAGITRAADDSGLYFISVRHY